MRVSVCVLGDGRCRQYRFGNTKTNLSLLLQHGGNERAFRMEYISNQPFTASEYEKWRDEAVQNEVSLPTLHEAERKAKAIEDAANYQHSLEDTRKIIEQKRKFGAAPTNFATRKEILRREMSVAEEKGEEENLARLKEQWANLEAAEMELYRTSQAALKSISSINQRNRKTNQEKIDKAVYSDGHGFNLCVPTKIGETQEEKDEEERLQREAAERRAKEEEAKQQKVTLRTRRCGCHALAYGRLWRWRKRWPALC